MPIFYADASALVKLLWEEPESDALRAYWKGAELLSCDLVLAELPRAARRVAAERSEFSLENALGRAAELLDGLGLRSVDEDLLEGAGALKPVLGALDAVHVASAIDLDPIDAFVTYDRRQAAAARRMGLRIVSPGA